MVELEGVVAVRSRRREVYIEGDLVFEEMRLCYARGGVDSILLVGRMIEYRKIEVIAVLAEAVLVLLSEADIDVVDLFFVGQDVGEYRLEGLFELRL